MSISKSKRQRITYSCSFCRSKKRKCDRIRPKCTFCSTHNRETCEYDSHSFHLKKEPEALQERFANVIYFDNTAESIETSIKNLERKLAVIKKSETSLPLICESDRVQLIDEENSIKFTKNKIKDIKPLTLLYLETKDEYVSVIKRVILQKYSLVKDSVTDARFQADINYLMNPVSYVFLQELKITNFKLLVNLFLDKESRYYEINQRFIKSFYLDKNHVNDRCHISCQLGYTNDSSLEPILKDIENRLPPLNILLYIWNVFEKFVYPFVPVIDLKVFKKDLELIIMGLKFYNSKNSTVDTNANINYKILPTSYQDFNLLSVFLLGLTLGYMALKINPEVVLAENKIEKEIFDCLNPIEFSFVDSAMACSVYSRTFQRPNLISIAAFILFYKYTMVAQERPKIIFSFDEIVGLHAIYGMAMKCGLHKNWSSLKYELSSKDINGISSESVPYIAQRIWHTIKSLDCEECLTTGMIVNKTKYTQPLPVSDIKTDDKDEATLNNLLDRNFKEQHEVNKLIEGIVSLVSTESDIQVLVLYQKTKEIDEYIENTFKVKGIPKSYFQNDENFQCPDEGFTYDNRLLVIRKLFKFNTYVKLMFLKLKISYCLFTYYESENADPHNSFYFFNRILTESKELSQIIHGQFVIKNKEFLKNNVDDKFDFDNKNFNFENLKLLDCITFEIFSYLLSLTARLFNTTKFIYDEGEMTLYNKKRLRKVSELKYLCIKFIRFLKDCFYQKYCKFGFKMLKSGICLDIVISNLESNTTQNDEGLPVNILSLQFGEELFNTKSCCSDSTFYVKVPEDCICAKYEFSDFDRLIRNLHGNNAEGKYWIDRYQQIIESNDLYRTFTPNFSFKETKNYILNQISKDE